LAWPLYFIAFAKKYIPSFHLAKVLEVRENLDLKVKSSFYHYEYEVVEVICRRRRHFGASAP